MRIKRVGIDVGCAMIRDMTRFHMDMLIPDQGSLAEFQSGFVFGGFGIRGRLQRSGQSCKK